MRYLMILGLLMTGFSIMGAFIFDASYLREGEVDCYDQKGNKIIGVKCEGTYYDYSGVENNIYSILILIVFILGLLFIVIDFIKMEGSI